MRALDISRLRRLVTARKHDDQNALAPREIKTLTWPEGDSHFRHIISDRLPIPQISSFRETEPSRNAKLRPYILERIEPVLELLRLADGEHSIIVSKWIRMSIYLLKEWRSPT